MLTPDFWPRTCLVSSSCHKGGADGCDCLQTVLSLAVCPAGPWWPFGQVRSTGEGKETQIQTVPGTPREWQGRHSSWVWVALEGLSPRLLLEQGSELTDRLGSSWGLRGSCPASDSISTLR